MVQLPGFEPGFAAWEAAVLPLDYRCSNLIEKTIITFLILSLLRYICKLINTLTVVYYNSDNMSTKYFCQNCGSIIEEGIKFCANCGTSVSERQPAAQQPVAQPAQAYTPAQPYAAAAPTYIPAQLGVPAGISPLSRTVALLLCIFFGWMGVHKFYVGKVGDGIIYLLFSWTGVPAFIAFIEIFIIANGTFRDDKGLPLVTW